MGFEFVIPAEVDAKITDADQRGQVDEMLARGVVKRESPASPAERSRPTSQHL